MKIKDQLLIVDYLIVLLWTFNDLTQSWLNGKFNLDEIVLSLFSVLIILTLRMAIPLTRILPVVGYPMLLALSYGCYLRFSMSNSLIMAYKSYNNPLICICVYLCIHICVYDLRQSFYDRIKE